MTEPSNAEIARRLDETASRLADVARDLATSYVRKDVYEAKHESLKTLMVNQVKDVADDQAEMKRQREKDADRWKQFAFALGLAILMLLIQGALTVSNFLARTSGS